MTSTLTLVTRINESETQKLLVKPFYSSLQATLNFNGQVIKRFRHCSPNQQIILCSFQEMGWPFRIDAPLPFEPRVDPKERLANAVKRLNQHHSNIGVIRFRINENSITWAVLEVCSNPIEPTRTPKA